MVKGNNLTTSSVIKYTSGLVEGQKVVPGDFGKSVKKLWATGFFSNIEINLERETLNGIDLIIIVEETPILGEIIFKGDKKKRNEIEGELDLNTGQRILPHVVKESEEKIKKILSESGFINCSVVGLSLIHI